MSQLADSHDNFCSCPTPFAHLLASIFPPGHQDRNLSINQILKRDYKELCLSGGGAASAGGGEKDGTNTNTTPKEEREEGYIKDEDLTELITAVEEDAAAR